MWKQALKTWLHGTTFQLLFIVIVLACVLPIIGSFRYGEVAVRCTSEARLARKSKELLGRRFGRQRIDALAPFIAKGLVLLKDAVGGHGTGFIISKKHRLVVTAAHVADNFNKNATMMVAIPEGTTSVHHIAKVWYHPGIVRQMDDGLYVRSDDPWDGKVAYGCPDIAVLELSQQEQELPGELVLARSEELEKSNSKIVGILSYSGDVEEGPWPIESPVHGWLTLGEIITSSNPASQNALDHSDAGIIKIISCIRHGASGAPVFLPNGHVVSIVSMGVGVSEQHLGPNIGHVRELLAFHNLAEIPGDLVKKARSHPNWGSDPRLEICRRAVRLVHDAKNLHKEGAYDKASERCNDAIALVGDYAGGLLERSKLYFDYATRNWNSLRPDQRAELIAWSFADSLKCTRVLPWWKEGHLIHVRNSTCLASLRSEQALFRSTIRHIDAIVFKNWSGAPLDETQRSDVLNCRARCHQLLGEMDEAEKDFTESIQLTPSRARLYVDRAKYWDQCGFPNMAIQDRHKASTLEEQGE